MTGDNSSMAFADAMDWRKVIELATEALVYQTRWIVTDSDKVAKISGDAETDMLFQIEGMFRKWHEANDE